MAAALGGSGRSASSSRALRRASRASSKGSSEGGGGVAAGGRGGFGGGAVGVGAAACGVGGGGGNGCGPCGGRRCSTFEGVEDAVLDGAHHGGCFSGADGGGGHCSGLILGDGRQKIGIRDGGDGDGG